MGYAICPPLLTLSVRHKMALPAQSILARSGRDFVASPPQITDEYYVFLGSSVQDVAPQLPDGVIYVESPSFQLYSPRTTNLATAPIMFRDRTKVYYYTHPDTYKDIYEFMLACRASKNTDNYYLMKPAGSIRELKEKATKPYNIVSGEHLSTTMDHMEKRLVHRYMMMGLHLYWTYLRCGLSKTKIVTISTTNQSRAVSAGGHMFQEDEGFAVNVNLLFSGLLIDYYRLESGTMGVNAQLAFTKDPEFRYLVYKYMREVFLAFTKHNLPPDAADVPGLVAKLETADGLSDQEVVGYASNIVGRLLE
jgi:hypothetical protein